MHYIWLCLTVFPNLPILIVVLHLCFITLFYCISVLASVYIDIYYVIVHEPAHTYSIHKANNWEQTLKITVNVFKKKKQVEHYRVARSRVALLTSMDARLYATPAAAPPWSLPFLLHNVDPCLIQHCLGPPHAPSQTTAQTVHAVSRTYATKSPLVTMGHHIFAPKITPSRWRIPKPHYLPHPWPCLTYHAKRHPDPFSRFPTIHWTDRPRDGYREMPITISHFSIAMRLIIITTR